MGVSALKQTVSAKKDLETFSQKFLRGPKCSCCCREAGQVLRNLFVVLFYVFALSLQAGGGGGGSQWFGLSHVEGQLPRAL